MAEAPDKDFKLACYEYITEDVKTSLKEIYETKNGVMRGRKHFQT